MSRSGYSDDGDNWALICWRGAVASSIRGKRGQSFLKEIVTALDNLPEKSLIAGDFQSKISGEFCTLGAVAKQRGINLSKIDPDDRMRIASTFEITESLAAEIMYMNDEYGCNYFWKTAEICGPMKRWESHTVQYKVINENVKYDRWKNMRKWAQEHIKEE